MAEKNADASIKKDEGLEEFFKHVRAGRACAVCAGSFPEATQSESRRDRCGRGVPPACVRAGRPGEERGLAVWVSVSMAT